MYVTLIPIVTEADTVVIEFVMLHVLCVTVRLAIQAHVTLRTSFAVG